MNMTKTNSDDLAKKVLSDELLALITGGQQQRNRPSPDNGNTNEEDGKPSHTRYIIRW